MGWGRMPMHCTSARARIPWKRTWLKKRGSAYSSYARPGAEIRTILIKVVNSCDLPINTDKGLVFYPSL